MPDTSLSSARALLNASESRLVAASRGATLTSATPAELKRKAARARALRDKWRAVYEQQRRGTQQTRRARGTAGNDRSREKSEIFGQVLARLEARLEKLNGSDGTASTRSRAKRPSKATRGRGHRQERARAKRSLAGEVASRASATVRSAQAARPPMQTRQEKPAAEPRGARKKRKTKTRATAGRKKAASPAATSTRGQSASAATRQRLAMSGRTTRVRAHVQARGRRAQARRDRRG